MNLRPAMVDWPRLQSRTVLHLLDVERSTEGRSYSLCGFLITAQFAEDVQTPECSRCSRTLVATQGAGHSMDGNYRAPGTGEGSGGRRRKPIPPCPRCGRQVHAEEAAYGRCDDCGEIL